MYKIESGLKMPKQRAVKGDAPAAVKKAYEAYATAYHGVYGVTPLGYSYNAATKFIELKGIGTFAVKVLRERTKQLIYRKG